MIDYYTPGFLKYGIHKAGIIALYNSRFLLVKNSKNGKYILPQVYIKDEETPYEAALRTAFDDAEILGSIYDIYGVSNDTIYYCFFIAAFKKCDSGKKCDKYVRFFSYEQVMSESFDVCEFTKYSIMLRQNKFMCVNNELDASKKN